MAEKNEKDAKEKKKKTFIPQCFNIFEDELMEFLSYVK